MLFKLVHPHSCLYELVNLSISGLNQDRPDEIENAVMAISSDRFGIDWAIYLECLFEIAHKLKGFFGQ